MKKYITNPKTLKEDSDTNIFSMYVQNEQGSQVLVISANWTHTPGTVDLYYFDVVKSVGSLLVVKMPKQT